MVDRSIKQTSTSSLSCEWAFVAPPPAPKNSSSKSSSYDAKYFSHWIDSLTSKVSHRIPNQDRRFVAACHTAELSQLSKEAAEKVVADLERHPLPDDAALDQAKAVVQQQTEALSSALEVCQAVAATQTLISPAVRMFLSDDFDDTELVTLAVLKDAGPDALAAWCDQGEDAAQQLLQFLQNTEQVRLFLQAGGARDGQYGRAVQLYYCELLPRLDPPPALRAFLERLALAVALELASPLLQFGSKATYIDPIQRYMHYERAYLFGELDPIVDTLAVWELRFVINSNAPNDQLGWGRESLRNFRPDHVYSSNPQWRYCGIVKTDVNYQAPEWYKEPRSYDQILAGGGKCGPRAWYGRFICKAFGIPTWGVQQPGHAAMSRWTSKGWMTCLGAAFKWTYWEGRGGLDFELETQARYACDNNNESTYLRHVLRLELLGRVLDEDASMTLRWAVPLSTSFWTSLGLVQRRILVANQKATLGTQDDCDSTSTLLPPTSPYESARGHQSLLQQLLDRTTPNLHHASVPPREGTIIIPAACPSDPARGSKHVQFLHSFLGGQQLLLTQNPTVTYDIGDDETSANAAPGQYELSLRICTVHRHEDPFLVTITDAEDASTVSVDIPYSEGLWVETEPVHVTIRPGAKLLVARQSSYLGLSIKDIRLVPVQ